MQTERKYYLQRMSVDYVVSACNETSHYFFNIEYSNGWKKTPGSLQVTLFRSRGIEVSKKWLLLRNIPLLQKDVD